MLNGKLCAPCYDMENISINGFFTFCKNNFLLLLTISIALCLTYGIKLLYYSIGIDSEMFSNDINGLLVWCNRIGRFGMSLLTLILYGKLFNPILAFLLTFCLIWFFTISWCYILAIFSKETGRNNKLISFALVFMISPVWVEQFYFVFQSAQLALMISLCPYLVFLLFRGILNNEKLTLFITMLLMTLVISVYQSMIIFFTCGIFICFLLFQENSTIDSMTTKKLCLKLFVILLASFILYYIVDKFIVSTFFNIEQSNYVDNMNQWGKRPFKTNIFDIVKFSFMLFNADIIHSFLVRFIPPSFNLPYITGLGNAFLLPCIVFYIIKIAVSIDKKIYPGRRLLYMIACIGVPFCIILLSILGGCIPPMHSIFALPLATGFMCFYIIKTSKKNVAIIILLIVLLNTVIQGRIISQLFYSDYIRYNEDVRVAYDLNDRIIAINPASEKLPVALVGNYQIHSDFTHGYLQGEVMGHSFFGWYSETVYRGLAFMGTLGHRFDAPSPSQIEQAREDARTMPCYPDVNCVKIIDDVIVVKLSD